MLNFQRLICHLDVLEQISVNLLLFLLIQVILILISFENLSNVWAYTEYGAGKKDAISSVCNAESILSFHDIKSFPAFLSFRKLLFVTDRSITFQFFHRKNLKQSNLPLNSCSITYLPNYSNYLGNGYYSECTNFNIEDESYETCFLRNPTYSNAVIL